MTRGKKFRTGVSLDPETVEKLDLLSEKHGTVFMRRNRSEIINLLLHCYFSDGTLPPLPEDMRTPPDQQQLQTANG